MKQKLFAFFAIAALLLGMSACTNDDNPSSGEEGKSVIPAQLKQGIWTEYDEALLTSGKYTAEELAEMPAVGMKIEGDKGYFFTYTAEDASEPVEGKISYNKSTGEGTITFPTIKDNPLSGQNQGQSALRPESQFLGYLRRDDAVRPDLRRPEDDRHLRMALRKPRQLELGYH